MTARARKLIIRGCVAIAAIAAIGWWAESRGAAKRSQSTTASRAGTTAGSAEGRAVPVQLARVEQKDLPIWLDGIGTVAAVQQVTVRSQVDGRLDKVMFTEGQPVKAGDVIAQLDPRPFEVQLHQAEGALARDRAQLENAKKTYERYKDLKDQQLVAQQQVDEYLAQVGNFEGAIKIDQAQVENAQLQLDYARVKAPIDGVTGIRLVDAGNLVHATDATGLVVITQINPAAVFFTVPQDRLSDVSAALARGEVKVEVRDRDGANVLGTGTLAVLDNQINQTTATLRLKALVPNEKHALWPNAFVKVRMLVDTRKNALVVPAVAVQRGPQGEFIYVVGADSTAQLRPVQVALTTGDSAVIAKGVNAGEQVVVEGANQLRPGGKVTAPAPAQARR